ncbi:hypothetical protein, partial [Streptococcus anginosus]|uniref:hypothetical protein n=1 Tax=Streptococcus anginosus TaxID=1328 RepID=UPI002ED98CB3
GMFGRLILQCGPVYRGPNWKCGAGCVEKTDSENMPKIKREGNSVWLSYLSIPMTKHQNQGNLHRKEFNLGAHG